ncbi:MAG: ribosomal protein S18-alanine N-acetyltransferase [Steroidobacteraceae bacterium]|nr:ribosomal protein S18-alanine N-acetyltransferase [Steroidobacteraceae bacterium]
MPGLAWRLRPMTPADLPRIAELERESYAFPWSDQIFADCLRVGYYCVVVETDDGVMGYSVLSMGAGEAHLLNLCIAGSLRRRGIGRELLLAVLGHARDRGIRDAYLEVRRSNRAAIALYQQTGFECVGQRRGYYQAHEGREDALVYRLELGTLG